MSRSDLELAVGLLWLGPGTRDEPVREVGIDGEGLADLQLLHRDEAQAIDEAVRLVLMPREVLERRGFVGFAGAVHATELSSEQLPADAYRDLVPRACVLGGLV
jgi:hypothetical protein